MCIVNEIFIIVLFRIPTSSLVCSVFGMCIFHAVQNAGRGGNPRRVALGAIAASLILSKCL